MAETVLVTGASGFVGRAVVERLLAHHKPVRGFARRGAAEEKSGLEWTSGDLADSSALDRAMAGCRAVIHLVGIIREGAKKGITFEKIHVEGTRAVVEAARRNGVRRIVQMSALGTRPGAVAEYHRTKYLAEEIVRGSGLEWTIIQPSLIHGPGGEFMQMECGWVRGTAAPFLFMPYFGKGILGLGGAGKLQPVFVEDVARAFVEAVDNPKTIGETYPLGGAEEVTWPGMHRMVARAMLGRLRPVIAIPVWYAKLLTRIAPATLLPFNRDQVEMSQENNTCDMKTFIRDFGWMPKGFEATLGKSIAFTAKPSGPPTQGRVG